jgi:uncharacterized protein (DUF4415 family)
MYDKDLTPHPDPEIRAFEEALLRSLDQAHSGTFARVTTPAEIVARRAGRPVGSMQATVKQPTTLRMDATALARWRASGKGWQTRAAALLVQHAPAA